MYFISLACIRVTAAKYIKIILSFFPPVTLEVGIVLISEFESHFRKYHPKYFTEIYTNYSLFYMYLQFIIDFILYLFLGYYLQNVLPHTYGIRKPFYFLFTSEYWCKNRRKNSNTMKKNEILNQSTIRKLTNFSGENSHTNSNTKSNTNSNNKSNNNSNTNSNSIGKTSIDNNSSDFEDFYKDNPNFEVETIKIEQKKMMMYYV